MSGNKKEQELKEILKKYLNNQATLSEAAAVDHWYDTLGFDQIKKPGIKQLYLKYAVACVLLITLSAGWFFSRSPDSPTPKKELVIVSGPAERKQITLTDGSEVMLNVHSQLIISRDFGAKDRKVTLKGEAYFKVAKNKEKPFFIQSGELSTRVLGTSFNINAYPRADRIKVSVLTGKVTVSRFDGKQHKALAKNMTTDKTISFYKSNGKFELNTENALLIASWRMHKLYIDNASIKDISEQLSRHYNMEVKDLSHHRNRDKYTIRFNNESMNGVLQILTALTERKFTYNNHRITIK